MTYGPFDDLANLMRQPLSDEASFQVGMEAIRLAKEGVKLTPEVRTMINTSNGPFAKYSVPTAKEIEDALDWGRVWGQQKTAWVWVRITGSLFKAVEKSKQQDNREGALKAAQSEVIRKGLRQEDVMGMHSATTMVVYSQLDRNEYDSSWTFRAEFRLRGERVGPYTEGRLAFSGTQEALLECSFVPPLRLVTVK